MVDEALKPVLPANALKIVEDEESREEYWANGNARDIAEHISDRITRCETMYDYSPLIPKIARSREYYYGFFDGEYDWGDTAIQVTGESGQMLTFSINMYRWVIRQLLTLVTSEKPSYDVVPMGVDAKSRVQASLGEKVLNHYLEVKKYHKTIKETIEDSLVNGTGFLEIFWDASMGSTYSDEGELDDEGYPVEYFEGDVRVVRRNFWDVIWDVDGVEDDDDVKWVAIKVRDNKYDLAAIYPDLADQILAIGIPQGSELHENAEEGAGNSGPKTDDIYYWRFYHKRTPALPEGRLTFFLAEHPDEPLKDIDLPYPDIPLIWTKPAKFEGQLLGWTPAFDIQKQQELICEVLSKVSTVFDTLGIPLMWAGGKGSQIPDPETFTGNVAFVQSEKKPEAINLGMIPEESFKILEMCVQSMKEVAGLSEASTGGTAGSLRANRMQVFQAEQTLRYNSDIEASYFETFERVGTGILKIMQSFPDRHRVIKMVGKENTDAFVSFAAEDLYSVLGVMVKPGSRLTRTTEGRLEVINILSQSGASIPKEEVLAILNGAPIEAITAGAEAELRNAQRENEELMRGGPHLALATDNHLLHIKKHAIILSSPLIRARDEIVRSVVSAVLEHVTLYNDPNIFQLQVALGYAGMPPMPGGGGPGGGGTRPQLSGGAANPQGPKAIAPPPEGAQAGALSEGTSNE